MIKSTSLLSEKCNLWKIMDIAVYNSHSKYNFKPFHLNKIDKIVYERKSKLFLSVRNSTLFNVVHKLLL